MPHSEDIATSTVLKFLGSLEQGQREVIPYEDLRRLRNSIRDSIDEAMRSERDACIQAAEASLPGRIVASAIRSARDTEMVRRWKYTSRPSRS